MVITGDFPTVISPDNILGACPISPHRLHLCTERSQGVTHVCMTDWWQGQSAHTLRSNRRYSVNMWTLVWSPMPLSVQHESVSSLSNDAQMLLINTSATLMTSLTSVGANLILQTSQNALGQKKLAVNDVTLLTHYV